MARRRRRLQKRYLKSDFALLQTFLRLVHLAQFVKCWQKKANTNEYDISSITALRTEICLSLSLAWLLALTKLFASLVTRVAWTDKGREQLCGRYMP